MAQDNSTLEVTVEVVDILQDIYDSEINISISWFWDMGIDIVIGDDANGIKAENNFDTVIEALAWLRDKIIELYPQSDFAKKWKSENAPK